MIVRGSPCPISAWLTRSCNPARDFPFSFQIFVDKFAAVQYTVKALRKQFEAWLSLVERSVRDAEAASSNLVASTRSEKSMQQVRPIGQAVKTEPSHGSNPGSIPGSVISSVSSEKRYTIFIEAWLSLVERSVRDAEAASSNLVASTRSEKSMQQVRPIGQAVKTEPSHGSNPGSIPGSVTLLS